MDAAAVELLVVADRYGDITVGLDVNAPHAILRDRKPCKARPRLRLVA